METVTYPASSLVLRLCRSRLAKLAIVLGRADGAWIRIMSSVALVESGSGRCYSSVVTLPWQISRLIRFDRGNAAVPWIFLPAWSQFTPGQHFLLLRLSWVSCSKPSSLGTAFALLSWSSAPVAGLGELAAVAAISFTSADAPEPSHSSRSVSNGLSLSCSCGC